MSSSTNQIVNPLLPSLCFLSVMSNSKKIFHSTFAVSNIKNHIFIILEMENVKYGTWAEIFKIHTRSHKGIHHIIPPEKSKEKKSFGIDAEKELWSTLCVFLGYPSNQRGYKCYDLSSQKIIISRHVIF